MPKEQSETYLRALENIVNKNLWSISLKVSPASARLGLDTDNQ
jgi:hypothetical protein